MTDAPLGSPESQAAWTALGTRMRRNRRRLLSALLILGLYMGTQAWLQLGSRLPRGNRAPTELAANVESASSATISSVPPGPAPQAAPAEESVTRHPSQPGSP